MSTFVNLGILDSIFVIVRIESKDVWFYEE